MSSGLELSVDEFVHNIQMEILERLELKWKSWPVGNLGWSSQQSSQQELLLSSPGSPPLSAILLCNILQLCFHSLLLSRLCSSLLLLSSCTVVLHSRGFCSISLSIFEGCSIQWCCLYSSVWNKSPCTAVYSWQISRLDSATADYSISRVKSFSFALMFDKFGFGTSFHLVGKCSRLQQQQQQPVAKQVWC